MQLVPDNFPLPVVLFFVDNVMSSLHVKYEIEQFFETSKIVEDDDDIQSICQNRLLVYE